MKEYFGGCHCGEVKFKFLSNDAVEIWKCNCSVCKLLDYEHLFIKHEDFKIIDGKQMTAVICLPSIILKSSCLIKRCS